VPARRRHCCGCDLGNDGFDRKRASLGGRKLVADGVLDLAAEGNLDGLLVKGTGVEGFRIELASHGIVIGAVATQEGLDGGDDLQNKSVGVCSASHGIVVGAVTAQETRWVGSGGGRKGDDGVAQVVVGRPVDFVVGRNKGLGEEGLFLLGGIAGTDALEDDGRIEDGHEVVGSTGVLVLCVLLFVGIEADGAGLGGGKVLGSLGGFDLVAKVDLELGGRFLLAEAGAVVGDGGHQERLGAHGVVVGAVAAQKSDGSLDLKDIRGSSSSPHGVVVGAVAAQKAVGALEIDGVGPGHVMANLPVDVVVGSDEGLSDKFHVLGGGFADGSLEDDLAIQKSVVVVLGDGLLEAEGRSLDRDKGEGKGGKRELHGERVSLLELF
jgi:hypothetical protein